MPIYHNEWEAISRRGSRSAGADARTDVPARVEVPGEAAAAAAIAREQQQARIRLQIIDLERDLSALRLDLVQFQRLVDNGATQYRGPLALKKHDVESLERRLNALHRAKE